ncbi:phage tail assembly protein [Pasteurella bettyae]|uniref:Phage tail protein E n=1 Tax=Pasteurella bettyae CCUG 2042 TaxID=1095749 RepID=I3DKC1_9PAST|nr:phage tail assembly protein [Pasteurella bettyae]EIJ72164.1 phage tail protein E [Pasteurella bettyae CCUG 2042]SUB20777.1 Phage tail protein E [Pasteurella bettyae]
MAKTKSNNSKTVKLTTPILRGEQKYNEITVIKPNVAALKGLKLLDVMQSDVNALTVLLPRVTQPMLHKNDFDNMDIRDFTELASETIGFLLPNSETETMASE